MLKNKLKESKEARVSLFKKYLNKYIRKNNYFYNKDYITSFLFDKIKRDLKRKKIKIKYRESKREIAYYFGYKYCIKRKIFNLVPIEYYYKNKGGIKNV